MVDGLLCDPQTAPMGGLKCLKTSHLLPSFPSFFHLFRHSSIFSVILPSLPSFFHLFRYSSISSVIIPSLPSFLHLFCYSSIPSVILPSLPSFFHFFRHSSISSDILPSLPSFFHPFRHSSISQFFPLSICTHKDVVLVLKSFLLMGFYQLRLPSSQHLTETRK